MSQPEPMFSNDVSKPGPNSCVSQIKKHTSLNSGSPMTRMMNQQQPQQPPMEHLRVLGTNSQILQARIMNSLNSGVTSPQVSLSPPGVFTNSASTNSEILQARMMNSLPRPGMVPPNMDQVSLSSLPWGLEVNAGKRS